MKEQNRLIIFTDLDGTLLDATTYAFDAATEALDAVRSRQIPVVLVSSKTRAEMEPLRFRVRLNDPFVVENGGGIFIPKGYFPFPIEGVVPRGDYFVVELGVPYAQLRSVLAELQQTCGHEVRGFGDMTSEEIAQLTGLSAAGALLSKQREYDEPFLFSGSSSALDQLREYIEAKGLRCVPGGRFFHLMGTQDKGHAVRLLSGWYRQLIETGSTYRVLTVGIGDSPNDLPMLAAVDRPFLVQRPDGSHDERMTLPGLNLVPAPGPSGWNRVVLDLLGHDDPSAPN
ncbi:HAD-IIB family hydrolase [Petrachloros mirabilis]